MTNSGNFFRPNCPFLQCILLFVHLVFSQTMICFSIAQPSKIIWKANNLSNICNKWVNWLNTIVYRTTQFRTNWKYKLARLIQNRVFPPNLVFFLLLLQELSSIYIGSKVKSYTVYCLLYLLSFVYLIT